MLEIIRSRTGLPTAIQHGIRLHSAYDPVREAVRFAARATEAREPGTILLLGAGLGYLIEALKAACPRARLLPVFYSREISGRCSPRPAVSWDPGSPDRLSVWLRRHIAELDAEGLVILEWPASARMYPDLSATANGEVRRLLQEHRGSLVTTMAAGRQWLANAFINAVSLNDFLAVNPRAPSLPIVVAASGPSLEGSDALLRKLRSRFRLWALPSAVPFLVGNGLIPDLVVVTDPSFYALYHLHAAHAAGPGKLNLAMPLSAATGAWRLKSPVFTINQGDFAETALLKLVGITAPTIPPQGTVAATALKLGLMIGGNDLVFAGLDLCHLDIRSHVRPNAFESFLAAGANRLSPLFSRLFSRSLEQAPERQDQSGRTCRTSLALRTYGGSLGDSDGPARPYRLNPTIIPLEGMRAIDTPGLKNLLAATAPGTAPPQFLLRQADRPREERRARALALLSDWEMRLPPEPGGDLISGLFAGGPALELAYAVAPARLAGAKRLLRRSDRDAAEEEARQLLQEIRRFLQGLRTRLESGGAGHEAL